MRNLILFVWLGFALQGCIFFGIRQTNTYVKQAAASFSKYERNEIPTLALDFYGFETTTDHLKGKVYLISRSALSPTDSLVKVVNSRLLKYEYQLDTIALVRYKETTQTKTNQGNPFRRKEIFNVLVDKTGKIVGSNIKTISGDSQCDYYLDYAMYRIMDDVTLSESFADYKWGIIHYSKWTFPDRFPNNTFGAWLKSGMERNIINIGN
jgi:hypothetical protein